MKKKVLFVGVVGGCLLCPAADGVWTASGTDLDWWNPVNWQAETVGGGAGASVSFKASDDVSVYLTNAVSFKTLDVYPGKTVIGGTGMFALSDATGGDGVSSFNVMAGTAVNVDVPVSGAMTICKQNSGTLYLNGRLTGITGFLHRSGVLAFDWSRTADTPSPVSGSENITENLIPQTAVTLEDGVAMRFNPRVSRADEQTFTVSLSKATPYVTLSDTTTLSAGQQVEASDGLLADGTFVRRVLNGTTVELSAVPLADADSVTLTVKAAPQYCSRQTFASMTVGKGTELQLNAGLQMLVKSFQGVGGDLTLTGPGRLVLQDTEAFTGRLVLTNDAVVSCANENPVSDNLPVTCDVLFHIDASNAETLTLDGDRVTAWRTVTGRGNVTATPAGATDPVLLPNAMNGKPVVDLGPAVDNGGMVWSSTVSGIKTFFVVLGSQAGGGTLLGTKEPLEGFQFARGNDLHANKGNLNASSVAVYPLTRDHAVFRYVPDNKPTYLPAGLVFWVNGSPGNYLTPLSGAYDLVSGKCTSPFAASAFSRVVDGTTVRTGSEGGQRLAEVILYSRLLSEAERQSVEAYLRKKWFGAAPRGWDGGYVESLVDNGTHNTDRAPVSTWPNTSSGTVRIGTFEQSGLCEYLTVTKMSLVFEQADFAKKLRLWNGPHVTFTARQTSETCPVPGAALHVDAGSNVETNEAGEVLFWGGVGGAGYACTNRLGLGKKPTLLADGLNGRPVVDFGGTSSKQHLVWHTNISVRALFYVLKAANPYVSFCGSVCPEMAVVDHFTRYTNHDSMIYDPNVQAGAKSGIVRLDGQRILHPHATVLPSDAFKLLGHTFDSAAMANAFGCGALQKGNLRAIRTGGLQLAEVLIYDRPLTDEESLAVQAYLRYKWFGETLPGFAAPDEPFAVPGIGAGMKGKEAYVTIRGTAPVSVGELFGENTMIFSAPDGAEVTIPGFALAPLKLNNACLATSGDVKRGVYINAGTTNRLVSRGGAFAGGALVYGTLAVKGDGALEMGTLYLYEGGTLLCAPDTDACAGITCTTIDAKSAVGHVRFELPASRLEDPVGRYTVVSGTGYTSDTSRANLEAWTMSSNLNLAKWNVRLDVTDTGMDVVVSSKGCVLTVR